MISESAIENVNITDSNDQWRLSDAFLSEKASMQTMKRSLCKTLKKLVAESFLVIKLKVKFSK